MSLKTILNSQKAKNFIIYGFGQAVNILSPLLVIPYLIKVCGEAGLGKIGVGYSFALIAMVFVDYGSYINGTKEIAIHFDNPIKIKEKFIQIYSSKIILILFVLLLSAVIICTVPFFSRDYRQLLLSLLVVVGQFINPTWFLQGIQNFKWITIVNITSKFIYIASVFVFIKTPEDYIYANAFLGIGLISASSFSIVWIINKYEIALSKINFNQGFDIIKREFSLTVSQLFFSFYQYTPIMIVSYIGGDFMAGQYRVVDQIVMMFRTYFQMFYNFIYPEVCLKIHKNSKLGIRYWLKINAANYMFILMLLVVFYFMVNDILSFFKVDVNKTNGIKPFFKLGLLVPVFLGITFSLKQLLFSFNQNKKYIITTILFTIICLVLTYFNVKEIGLMGSFLSIIIIETCIIIVYLMILKPFIFVNKNR